jgi:hypothetical protein
MNSVPFFEIFGPTQTLYKILAMSPFRTENGEIFYSKLGLVQTFTYVTICLGMALVYFKMFFEFTYFGFGNVQVVRFVVTFRLLSSILLMILILYFTLTNHKKIRATLELVVEMDSKLGRYVQNEQIEKANLRLKKFSISTTCVVFTFLFAAEMYTYFQKSEKSRVFYVVISAYPRFVITLKNMTFCLFTAVLQERFKIINRIISKKVIESKKVHKYVDPNFEKTLNDLLILHTTLITVSTEINAIYSLQLLLWIARNFTLLLADSYTLVHMICFKSIEKYYRFGIFLILNCTTYVASTYYLSRRTAKLCKQVTFSFCIIVIQIVTILGKPYQKSLVRD